MPFRGERARSEYDKQQRQRQIVLVSLCAASLHGQRIGPLLAPDPVNHLRIAVVNMPDVLLNDLLPEFSRQTGIVVTLAVFSNQAVLVGPASDPAGIRGLTDAVEAFRRIAQRGGEFLVNNAPTERYLAEVLWQASGAPPKQGWQVNLGLRDQAAIEMASQRRAYTLWGIVPFVRLQAQRQLGMEPLVAGDPLFQRVMVSIVVNPARFPRANVEAALALERFLLDPKTQASMRQFRHHGLAGQTWWPAGRHNAGAELMQF